MEPRRGIPASMDTFVGRLLRNTYQIVSVLDEGAMGTVYLAEHTRLGRSVAVKVLLRRLVGSNQAMTRFEREAKAISRLSHPHVVQILDFDRADTGEPYLVMELLRGENLAQRLDRCGKFELEAAVEVILQMASALHAAHLSAIIHRDLKPANIFLLNMDDGSEFIKLLDFGISKCLDSGEHITGQFDVLGTPDYMCPEQASGLTAHVDARGDQFSLAVIAFEILSGRLPFFGSNLTEILRNIIQCPPPSLTALVPRAPEALTAVILRALSKNPRDRYPDMAGFAAALAQAIGRAPGRSWAPPSSPGATVPAPSGVRSSSVASRVDQDGAGLDFEEVAFPDEDPMTSVRKRTMGRQMSQATVHSPADRIDRATGEVAEGLRQAHEALQQGDLPSTWAYLQESTNAARDLQEVELRKALSGADSLLERLIEGALGSLHQEVKLSSEAVLNPREAFLISLFSPGNSLTHILDLSPMPREETLWILLALVRRGVVTPDDR